MPVEPQAGIKSARNLFSKFGNRLPRIGVKFNVADSLFGVAQIPRIRCDVFSQIAMGGAKCRL